jgi:hypothetical protein
VQLHQTSKEQAKPAFLSHESNEGWHRNTNSCGMTDPKGARDRRGEPEAYRRGCSRGQASEPKLERLGNDKPNKRQVGAGGDVQHLETSRI